MASVAPGGRETVSVSSAKAKEKQDQTNSDEDIGDIEHSRVQRPRANDQEVDHASVIDEPVHEIAVAPASRTTDPKLIRRFRRSAKQTAG